MARPKPSAPSNAILPGAPITAERQDFIFRIFASVVYFIFFAVCLFFLLRNCRTLIPGSVRAQRALCPAADSLASHFPVMGNLWDKLATDVFPIARPQDEAVFFFLSRLTTLVLGPLSLLLGWQFLKGWPKQRLVMGHAYFWSLFATATAVAVQLEHADNDQWAQAQPVVVCVFAFWILFPIAVSLSTLPNRGGAFGGAMRVIAMIGFIATFSAIWEFAVDYVPGHGATSIVDAVTDHPLAAAAAPHLNMVRTQAVQQGARVQQALHDTFDTVAEQGAVIVSNAAPHVQSAASSLADAATSTSRTIYQRIMDAIKGTGKKQ